MLHLLTETTYNYYTVTFVPNNGTEEAPAEDITVNVVPELPEQFPVPAFPELTYEGHTLAGWYADSAFENSADLASLTGAATFYAKWTENPTEPYPPAEGNARGEITMEVGEIRTQNGSKGSGHAWTSSDLSIVKITDDDDEREVKFKGVSAGTAYLTHTYTNKGNQVTEYWKVTVSPAAPKTYTVRFSANGGSGSAPESVTVKEGETITLPGQGNLSGYGKVFVGWSNGSDATGSDNFTSQFVYPSGSYYTVTENVTLYATWASQGVTGTFFIRLDGRIPYEPGGYDSSDYSSGITIKNVISVAKFTSGESAVLANLRATPTADQIKKYGPPMIIVLNISSGTLSSMKATAGISTASCLREILST